MHERRARFLPGVDPALNVTGRGETRILRGLHRHTSACPHKIAIVRQSLADVRFAPEGGQIADISGCPLCANRVLTHHSKKAPLFDHTSSARATPAG